MIPSPADDRLPRVSAAEEGPPPGPDETVTAVGRRRVHVPDALARGVLTLLLLGLIAWVLLDNVGNLEDVGEALAGVSLQAGILLVVLLLSCRS